MNVTREGEGRDNYREGSEILEVGGVVEDGGQ
jgi:hypothetical protein